MGVCLTGPVQTWLDGIDNVFELALFIDDWAGSMLGLNKSQLMISRGCHVRLLLEPKSRLLVKLHTR